MNSRLNEILEEIRELEKQVQSEMKRREEELKYKISEGKVIFEQEILELHKKIRIPLSVYIIKAPLLTILSAPIIYAMVVPAVLMDLSLWIYQTVCFPIYKIPKVKRSDHIIFDRHYLKYLNLLERMNCDYCSYFNGASSTIKCNTWESRKGDAILSVYAKELQTSYHGRKRSHSQNALGG